LERRSRLELETWFLENRQINFCHKKFSYPDITEWCVFVNKSIISNFNTLVGLNYSSLQKVLIKKLFHNVDNFYFTN